MPPKPRFTREEIVAAALDIVSRQGIEALTARELGEVLGNSARPIFTVFRSMEELQQEVRSAVSFDDVFGELGDTAERCIEAVCRDYDLSPAQARVLFEHVWIYTFGVGALCATRVCRFSEEQLGRMLSTEFQAMMLLVKSGGQS